MPPKLSEVELLLNKAALHQARLREALGFKTEVVDDAESRRQEEELFKCEPEFAGVGYRAKDDPALELKRKAASSDDKLRHQLLGKSSKLSTANKVTPKGQGKASIALRDSESDDDEEGRSATFKSKRRKLVTETKHQSTPGLKADVSADQSTAIPKNQQALFSTSKDMSSEPSAETTSLRPVADRPRKVVAQSYLDELLAQKAKKRKKHKKNKEGHGDDNGHKSS